MPKIRLYLDTDLPHRNVTLGQEQVHYLFHVMRQRQDDEINLFNAKDGQWQATITSITKSSAELQCHTLLRAPEPASDNDIWLCFAPVKNAPLYFIAQKATELGVSALKPVKTARTVNHKCSTEKLQKNVIEATEQCQRLDLPIVDDITTLKTLLENWPQERRLFLCNESGSGIPLKEALSNTEKGQYGFLIGPEGGFTPEELAEMHRHDYVTSVSLGPNILRADTAAIAALSCFQSLSGNWNAPIKSDLS